MKINDKSILIMKCEMKKSKDDKAYLLIDFMDISSGDTFNIMSKDIELMNKLKPMHKYVCTLDISSSKYGLRMEILDISKELGVFQ